MEFLSLDGNPIGVATVVAADLLDKEEQSNAKKP